MSNSNLFYRVIKDSLLKLLNNVSHNIHGIVIQINQLKIKCKKTSALL